MNATVMAMLLIAVHVMICVLMCVLPRFGVLRVEGRLLPFMLLVPLWGPLCVLLLHVRTLIRAGEHTAPGLEQMRVDDEERRSILVEERTDFANTVPLEEALIVNGPSHRRSLVMSILNDNPSRYIDVLSQARLNEDVEVVHYAATALAQISAKEDLALQRCATIICSIEIPKRCWNAIAMRWNDISIPVLRKDTHCSCRSSDMPKYCRNDFANMAIITLRAVLRKCKSILDSLMMPRTPLTALWNSGRIKAMYG